MRGLLLLLFIGFAYNAIYAQRPTRPVAADDSRGGGNIGNNLQQLGGRFGQGGGPQRANKDTLTKRDLSEDSITISYKLFGDTKSYLFDTSVNDFYNKIKFPAAYRHIGNLGNAAQSLIWNPLMQAGFNAGFNNHDIYKFTIDNTPLFNSNKPFTELDYLVGSKVEQYINILHTQNIKPNLNITANYKVINSLGFLKNHQSNNNSYRFVTAYISKNKRYQNIFVINGNRFRNGENGGIRNNIDYINNPTYVDRSNIPVNIGDTLTTSRAFFSTPILSGNKHGETHLLLRQSYDIGKKDSLVTDSFNYAIFYTKWRLQHTVSYKNNVYTFIDSQNDSAYYKNNYAIDNNRYQSGALLILRDRYKIVENDFSIYQFPDRLNTQQYIMAGISAQQIAGRFDSVAKNDTTQISDQLNNLWIHGQYRNISKNKKWDIDAKAQFYFAGWNAGDYYWQLKLKSLVSKKLGSFEVMAENSNQKPSYVFQPKSAYTRFVNSNYNKQNMLHFAFSFDNAPLQLSAAAHLYTVTNYTYWQNFTTVAQDNLFNVFQVIVDKKFNLSRRWKLYSQFAYQQRIGNSNLFLPNLVTRQRLAYEKRIAKMNLHTGIELRYFTNYKVQTYGPVGAQFIFQNQTTLANQLPDIHAFLHFKIRGFYAFIRAENLNAVNLQFGDNAQFNFNNNSLFNTNYLMPGLQMRAGIFWEFLN
jgi:hypothetical protein